MCLTNPLGRFKQNMVNMKTYKHFSEKRISGAAVRCSEEWLVQNSKEIGVLSNVKGCGYLTTIRYWKIPAFHIL